MKGEHGAYRRESTTTRENRRVWVYVYGGPLPEGARSARSLAARTNAPCPRCLLPSDRETMMAERSTSKKPRRERAATEA